ncbi:MAG TPA: sensor histidine kinase [Kofleriaceae bacterium]|nr:sensor histidine kinase [Kofleriaceae bacterium]
MSSAANLVGNAVKHGEPGKPIAVRVRADDGHAVVEVHNEGAIPSEVLSTLFEPFASRGPRAKRHKDGLGLGLFIARSIARAHGGELPPDPRHAARPTLPDAHAIVGTNVPWNVIGTWWSSQTLATGPSGMRAAS